MRCAVRPIPRRRAQLPMLRARVHIPRRERSARRVHRGSRMQTRAAVPASREALIARTVLAEYVRREARVPCTEIRREELRRIPQARSAAAARAIPQHARALLYYTGEKQGLSREPTDSFAVSRKRSSGLLPRSLSGSPRSSEFAVASIR